MDLLQMLDAVMRSGGFIVVAAIAVLCLARLRSEKMEERRLLLERIEAMHDRYDRLRWGGDADGTEPRAPAPEPPTTASHEEREPVAVYVAVEPNAATPEERIAALESALLRIRSISASQEPRRLERITEIAEEALRPAGVRGPE